MINKLTSGNISELEQQNKMQPYTVSLLIQQFIYQSDFVIFKISQKLCKTHLLLQQSYKPYHNMGDTSSRNLHRI